MRFIFEIGAGSITRGEYVDVYYEQHPPLNFPMREVPGLRKGLDRSSTVIVRHIYMFKMRVHKLSSRRSCNISVVEIKESVVNDEISSDIHMSPPLLQS